MAVEELGHTNMALTVKGCKEGGAISDGRGSGPKPKLGEDMEQLVYAVAARELRQVRLRDVTGDRRNSRHRATKCLDKKKLP